MIGTPTLYILVTFVKKKKKRFYTGLCSSFSHYFEPSRLKKSGDKIKFILLILKRPKRKSIQKYLNSIWHDYRINADIHKQINMYLITSDINKKFY